MKSRKITRNRSNESKSDVWVATDNQINEIVSNGYNHESMLRIVK